MEPLTLVNFFFFGEKYRRKENNISWSLPQSGSHQRCGQAQLWRGDFVSVAEARRAHQRHMRHGAHMRHGGRHGTHSSKHRKGHPLKSQKSEKICKNLKALRALCLLFYDRVWCCLIAEAEEFVWSVQIILSFSLAFGTALFSWRFDITW